MTDQLAPATTRLSRRHWLAAALGCGLLDLPSAAGADWASRSRVGIWHLLATIKPSELAQYERQLGNLQREVAERIPLPPPQGPVTVVMLANEREYHRYIKTYFPHAPCRFCSTRDSRSTSSNNPSAS